MGCSHPTVKIGVRQERGRLHIGVAATAWRETLGQWKQAQNLTNAWFETRGFRPGTGERAEV
jgi:hypothetical protein